MSLSPEFIAKARAIAFYRKFKVRRARRDDMTWCDNKGLPGWKKLGEGYFGEAWAHVDFGGLVVKVSGRAGFGSGGLGKSAPSLDGWPTFAQHCLAHPHPNLPKILHFERLSVGVSWGVMPCYASIDHHNVAADAAIVTKWRNYLEGCKGAPEWMWPIIGMQNALGMRVDLHGGNVMMDMSTGEYIMTDPFSFVNGEDD